MTAPVLMTPEALRAAVPLHIDSTIMAAIRSCQMKGVWEFLLNLRAGRKSVDLHAGGCFASAIEVLYRDLYSGVAPADALAKAEFRFWREWGDFETDKPGSSKTRERVWEAVLSYYQTYLPPNDHLKPWFDGVENPLEFSFAIPLDKETTGIDFPLHPSGDPFIYCGRFDALVLHSGLPCIRDDKTTSSLGESWPRKWALRAQFIGYCWAMQLLGYKIEHVAVRGIAILKTQINHAEIIRPYPPFLIDRWLGQLKRDLTGFLSAVESGNFNYDLGDHCTAYSGCPYVDLCTSPTPESWFSTFEVVKWNPLLRVPLVPTKEKD